MRIFILLLFTASCSVGVNQKQWNLAEAQLKTGEYLKAIEEFSRIVNFEKRTEIAAKAQEKIAYIYENHLKDYPRAIRAYRDLIKRTTENKERLAARLTIARIYSEKMQSPLLAAEEYQIIYEQYSKDSILRPEIIFKLAKNLYDGEKFSEAIIRFEEFNKDFPGHQYQQDCLYYQALSYNAIKKTEKAIKILNELIENNTNVENKETLLAEYKYALGTTYEIREEIDQALLYFKESQKSYPNQKVVELKIERLEKRKKKKKF